MKHITEMERDILTAIGGASVNDTLQDVQKYMKCDKKELDKIKNKLMEDKMIKVVKLPNGQFYAYTSKVKGFMLNDDIRYKKDFGDEGMALNWYLNKKLKEFQKDKNKSYMAIKFPKRGKNGQN